jgi:hypothetical protein
VNLANEWSTIAIGADWDPWSMPLAERKSGHGPISRRDSAGARKHERKRPVLQMDYLSVVGGGTSALDRPVEMDTRTRQQSGCGKDQFKSDDAPPFQS